LLPCTLPIYFFTTDEKPSSPYINRFLQPDTIIPDLSNPQSWNRYSYVTNRPVNFNDPSGHKYCDNKGENDCSQYSNSIEHQLRKYRVKLKGNWKDHVNEQLAVLAAVQKVGTKFAAERGLGESASQAFGSVYGHLALKWEGGVGICGDSTKPVNSGGCTDGAHQIRFWSLTGHVQNDMTRMIKNVVHELGHAFDWTTYNSDDLTRASNHIPGGLTRDTVLRPNVPTGRLDWQQHPGADGAEFFADMFIAWTYNAWNTSIDPLNVAAVGAAQDWMNGLAQP
jgi:hypothetical protein